MQTLPSHRPAPGLTPHERASLLELRSQTAPIGTPGRTWDGFLLDRDEVAAVDRILDADAAIKRAGELSA